MLESSTSPGPHPLKTRPQQHLQQLGEQQKWPFHLPPSVLHHWPSIILPPLNAQILNQIKGGLPVSCLVSLLSIQSYFMTVPDT